MIKDFIIDIDNKLYFIEEEIKKYVTLPEGTLFIKGNRAPLDERSKIDQYAKAGIISNEPWHPYISAYILRDSLYSRLLANNAFGELTSNNPAIDDEESRPVYPIASSLDIEEIVAEYLPAVTTDSAEFIITEMNKVLDYVETILKDFNSIYVIDVDTGFVKIKNLGHIESYRFREAMDYINIIKENRRKEEVNDV